MTNILKCLTTLLPICVYIYTLIYKHISLYVYMYLHSISQNKYTCWNLLPPPPDPILVIVMIKLWNLQICNMQSSRVSHSVLRSLCSLCLYLYSIKFAFQNMTAPKLLGNLPIPVTQVTSFHSNTTAWPTVPNLAFPGEGNLICQIDWAIGYLVSL